MDKEEATRILVVDDEEDLCEILKYNLETEGYQVDTALSGEEALEKDVASYQLILLDVMMGGMSGFSVARKLREDSSLPRVQRMIRSRGSTSVPTIIYLSLSPSVRFCFALEPCCGERALLLRAHQPLMRT